MRQPARPIPDDVLEYARTVLASKWAPIGHKGCWHMPRPRSNGQGYVAFKYKRITYQAHRVAVLLSGRQLAQTDLVCHHCDNPPCVNPAHLFVGSNADNIKDMYAKGRRDCRRDPAEYCLKCGHHRIDDVPARSKRTPARCRACLNERAAQYRARKRAARLSGSSR